MSTTIIFVHLDVELVQSMRALSTQSTASMILTVKEPAHVQRRSTHMYVMIACKNHSNIAIDEYMRGR